MQRFLLSLLCLSAFATDTLGQAFIRLKGEVLDAKTNEPIPYATVRVKGVAVGTITNLSGKYSFWLDKGYTNGTLVVSMVGYHQRELDIEGLISEPSNTILLREDARLLKGVTVVSDEQLTGLEVLKRAVQRIPENYVTSQHQFDAYYRELVTENGAAIKFADAVVTFEQTGYDLARYKQGTWGIKTMNRTGPWLGGYNGMQRIGDRLHDHFGHPTAPGDLVFIHEARASLNNTRHHFSANIEAGPLGALAKDLVKYISHVIDKRAFHSYDYELAEIDIGNNQQDYLIRFKTKKKPAVLTGDNSIVGGGSLKNIFNGTIQVDPETYVIKKLVYWVGNKHRPYICSLGLGDIIHYGYRVEVDYQEHEEKWRMQRVRRVDEFLLPEKSTEKITPYTAETEIWVTDQDSKMSTSQLLPHKNENHFYLQEYHSPYNGEFWTSYAAAHPEARINDTIRKELSHQVLLEEQFALQGKRKDPLNLPKLQPENGMRETGFFEQNGNPGQPSKIEDYLNDELKYTSEYFRPLHKVKADLMVEMKASARKIYLHDTTGNLVYKTWANFKDRTGYRKVLKSRKAYAVKRHLIEHGRGKDTPVTVVLYGDVKSSTLPKRPLFISVIESQGSGPQLPFDKSIIPLLKRGFIFAYAHISESENRSPDWFKSGNINRKKRLPLILEELTGYLTKNGIGDSSKVFLKAKGAGASMAASAALKNPNMFLGLFLESGQYAASEALGKSGRGQEKITLPISSVVNGPFPNAVFITESQEEKKRLPLRMLAKLRATKTDEDVLLLAQYDFKETDSEDGLISDRVLDQYILALQWLEDQRLSQIEKQGNQTNK